ncbi:unnamed protein product [Durusdinium trenchii]|uniref:Uncharacterized protein n=1 Tax=Durusdinium trenchii TaxID=1381693 RepID=A0ABP0L0A6_9DINO
MDGSMTIPGLPKPALECPTDILEKEPAPPRLNLLTPRSDLYPIIPQNIMQEYGAHESFSEEFNSFLDKVVEEFGPIPQDESAEDKKNKETGQDNKEKDGNGKDEPNKAEGETKAPRKRKSGGANGADAKKQKVDSSKVKTIDSVGKQGALVETPLINAKIEGVQLHIKSQNKPYLFNTGAQEASLKAGLIICGFGKGKWKLAEGSQENNPRTEVLFELSGPDDLVLFNGHLKTVFEVVQAQQQKVPKVRIAHHTMTEEPDAKRPGNFNLKRSHSVWFVPQAGNV